MHVLEKALLLQHYYPVTNVSVCACSGVLQVHYYPGKEKIAVAEFALFSGRKSVCASGLIRQKLIRVYSPHTNRFSLISQHNPPTPVNFLRYPHHPPERPNWVTPVEFAIFHSGIGGCHGEGCAHWAASDATQQADGNNNTNGNSNFQHSATYPACGSSNRAGVAAIGCASSCQRKRCHW